MMICIYVTTKAYWRSKTDYIISLFLIYITYFSPHRTIVLETDQHIPNYILMIQLIIIRYLIFINLSDNNQSCFITLWVYNH